jgi:hypothetical protein
MKFRAQSDRLFRCRTVVRILALALVLYPLVSLSQSQLSGGSIEGAVTDPSSAALAGARVALLDTEGKEIQRTQSDRAGKFHFDGLGMRAYQIRIERNGFKPLLQLLQVKEQQSIVLTFQMTIAVSAEQVTVIG